MHLAYLQCWLQTAAATPAERKITLLKIGQYCMNHFSKVFNYKIQITSKKLYIRMYILLLKSQ